MNPLRRFFRRFPLAALLMVSLMLALQSCQAKTTPTPYLTPTPEVTDLFPDRPTLDVTQTATIREQLRPTWNYANYQEYDTFDGRHIGEWSTFLVSSGIFEQAEITLSTGETFQLDVVFAYQTTQTNATITLPVVIGLLTEDSYLYFSPYAAYAGNIPGAYSFTQLSRADALTDAQIRLAEGRVFSLSIAEYVNRKGFLWADCPAYAERMSLPAAYCTVGENLDTVFPLQARLLAMRSLSEVPLTWLVFGFWFYEMETPDA